MADGDGVRDDGWQTVNRRKKIVTEAGKLKRYQWPASVVSYYISNLPEGCSRYRLRKECAQFGKVVDVFISNKPGKGGEIFGFVKFDEVKDKVMLERVLGKIKMGNQVISANLEKFDKNKKFIRSRSEVPNNPDKGNNGVKVWSRINWGSQNRVNETFNQTSCSYAEMVAKRDDRRMVVVKELKNSKTNEWVGVSLIGKAADYDSFNLLHRRLYDEGFQNIQIRHVGGFQVLLSFVGGEEAEAFRESMVHRKDLFEHLRFWDGEMTSRERFVWVKISGVPPLLWDAEVIDKIGGNFGRVVRSSGADEYDANLAWKKVGIISSSFDQIDGIVMVEWEKKIVRVRVAEIVDEWLPEFIRGQAGIATVAES
ncbi:hypothetical protein SSX86_012637 [Deinandra increscens subsp. villosa]|uniref:RRM domain-containing protein n=1 Tax=Deinandra increscens subsp. villosa TaxID=3103831 RepID=A0AAP0D8V6_9ASTR